MFVSAAMCHLFRAQEPGEYGDDWDYEDDDYPDDGLDDYEDERGRS